MFKLETEIRNLKLEVRKAAAGPLPPPSPKERELDSIIYSNPFWRTKYYFGTNQGSSLAPPLKLQRHAGGQREVAPNFSGGRRRV